MSVRVSRGTGTLAMFTDTSLPPASGNSKLMLLCSPTSITSGIRVLRLWSNMSSWLSGLRGKVSCTVRTAADLCLRRPGPSADWLTWAFGDFSFDDATLAANRHFSHSPARPTLEPPLVVMVMIRFPSNQLSDWPPLSRNSATGDLNEAEVIRDFTSDQKNPTYCKRVKTENHNIKMHKHLKRFY